MALAYGDPPTKGSGILAQHGLGHVTGLAVAGNAGPAAADLEAGHLRAGIQSAVGACIGARVFIKLGRLLDNGRDGGGGGRSTLLRGLVALDRCDHGYFIHALPLEP